MIAQWLRAGVLVPGWPGLNVGSASNRRDIVGNINSPPCVSVSSLVKNRSDITYKIA